MSVDHNKSLVYTRDTTDLEESISLARMAVECTLPNHPDYIQRLGNLSTQMATKSLQAQNIQHLEEPIAMTKRTLGFMPQIHPGFADYTHSLGHQYRDRFRQIGEFSDIKEAVALMKRSIQLTPGHDANLSGRLHDLALALGDKHLFPGQGSDIQAAIAMARRALELTPRDHEELPEGYIISASNLVPDTSEPKPSRTLTKLLILATRLRDKYESTRDTDVLDESVHAAREAIEVAPQDIAGTKLGDRLASLAWQLGARYARIGSLEDLKEAIAATPMEHKDRADSLVNLGIRLGLKYARTKETADLHESINVAQQAMTDDNPGRAVALEVLGIRLRNRYLRTSNLNDLSESLRMTREALEVTQLLSRRAGLFFNLPVKLRLKYLHTKAMEDMQQATCACRTAIKGTPNDDPNLARRLHVLGSQLRTQYSRTKVAVDLEEAV
ncbi:TPR domain-containing protein [Fusarium globosum]|uniref:TPR domain-containing protein n=1 Tax=Fusarium globosum TaxID=78864 RepID=A0A8H5YTE0_9HYPO|nr:TPR domain-containing protein [Fusarium globosum]